ncbi:hypothetical protein NPIL_88431 [Nephila pilipes]|uniref:PNK FHA domain-containing protein n=1 Tax=Nephila pilipes TaxID=299642 RepID=A0A8X6PW06_NEPPI|nr:hypothetical protein NPIL_88431 [Nephila pilipes]
MSLKTGEMKQCLLRSRNYKYRDVVLPNQVPVIVGRGPQTKIRDRKCSKNQVQIIADYEKKKAVIQQLGPNPSEVDNKLLVFQAEAEVSDGASINLLEEDLKFTLEFLDSEPKIRNKHHSKISPDVTPKKLKTTNSIRDENSFSLSKSEDSSPSTSNAETNCTDGTAEKMTDEVKEMQSEQESVQKTIMNAFSSLSTEDRWEEYDHSKILIFTPVGLRPQDKVIV